MLDTRHITTPGEVIRSAYLEPAGISEEDLADLLGVNPSQLAGVLQGDSKMTPEIAISLSRVFGAYVEYWWALQDRADVTDLVES